MVSEKQIQELLQSGESTTIEFKLCTDHLSASVYETVCAFLNREGGQIIVGADDNGTLIGVNKLSREQVTDKLPIGHRQVTDKLRIDLYVIKLILSFCEEAKPTSAIIKIADLKDRDTFLNKMIKPLISEGLLSMTLPNKITSPLQKYYTTEKGKLLLLDIGQDSQ